MIIQVFQMCFFFTFIMMTSSATLAHTYNKYRDHAGSFSTVLLDVDSNNVLIGGVNKVYKLNSDLELLVQGSIGPKLDHPDCTFPPPADCAQERTIRNNSNKLLQIYDDKIISCGTVYQGSCEFLYRSNLTLIAQEIVPVINTESKSASIVSLDAEPKLFIGTSPVSEPDLPAYAIRSPLNFEVYKKQSVTKAQKKATDDAIKGGFLIDFIHAFVSNEINYFVIVYDEKYGETMHKYQTYITHHCQSDLSYLSYIELPLVCLHNGQSYTLAQSAYLAKRVPSQSNSSGLVLVVTFGMSENAASLIPERKSAVCMYSLTDTIEYSFLEAYKACARGNTMFKTIKWAGYSQNTCIDNSYWSWYLESVQVPYCHDLEQIPDLGGNAPITADAIYQEVNTLFTSVVFQYIDEVQESVIFLGDDEGRLTKLRLNSANAAQKYEKLTIDAGSVVIRNGLVFSTDDASIYMITQQQITKIPVEECEQYTTCNECLGVGDGAGDPYCGWCTLMKRCTRKNHKACRGAHKVAKNRWLNSLDQCIQISKIEPANLASNMQVELTLTVRSLPKAPAETYFCIFENIQTTPVILIDSSTTPPTLKCRTPPEGYIQSGGSLEVKLSLLSNETNMEFVSTEFVFYNCSAFKDCTSCVSSNFACDWCIYENKCTGNSQQCKLQGVVGGQGNALTNATKFGPDNCPRLAKQDTEILLPVNTRKAIAVVAQNLPTLEAGHIEYECVLDEKVVKAEVTADTIRCKSNEYSYSEWMQEKPILLGVRWNHDFMIDNPYNVTVTLYKCEVFRDTCGKCLFADSKYDCGWCDQDVCVIRDNCEIETSFLTGNVFCFNPKINSFNPLKGPIEGGTRLVINGENLGLSFNDTMGITVADVECVLEKEGFMPSEQLQCTLSNTGNMKNGPVKITLSKGDTTYSATSESVYAFVIPVVNRISPNLGPQSGGTHVVLEGQHLDAGSTVNVTIADHQCLNIEKKNDGTIHCTTSPVSNMTTGGVRLMIDNGEDDSGVMFKYEADPIIAEIDPDRSIASGGTDIKVSGMNLHVANNRMLTMTISNKIFYGDCMNATMDSMTCKAPNIFSKFDPGDSDSMLVPSYGFILDGVEKYQSVQGLEKFQSFKYYVNPVYYQLENNVYKRDDEENLDILGQNLNLASRKDDVKVRIGRGKCEVIDLGSSLLTCMPPKEQPLSLDGSDSSAEVIVYHGNLNFSVGSLEYYKPLLPLPLEVLIPIVVVIILIIVFILVYYVYRYKLKLKTLERIQSGSKRPIDYRSKAVDEDGLKMAQLTPRPTQHKAYDDNHVYDPFYDEIKPHLPPRSGTSELLDNSDGRYISAMQATDDEGYLKTIMLAEDNNAGLDVKPIGPEPTQPNEAPYETHLYTSEHHDM
ncbi:plexin-A4-like [Anneissia japonica]|uniref:plexin-A4-like n=1 Tax=Anneissia japonica TaxID=1529436 RepID=UPI001425667C|nr:plexin-A4-like [Anneissia japonica]